MQNGHAVIEMENGVMNTIHPWNSRTDLWYSKIQDITASDGQAIQANLFGTLGKNEQDFIKNDVNRSMWGETIFTDQPGTYSLWIRAKFDDAEQASIRLALPRCRQECSSTRLSCRTTHIIRRQHRRSRWTYTTRILHSNTTRIKWRLCRNRCCTGQ